MKFVDTTYDKNDIFSYKNIRNELARFRNGGNSYNDKDVLDTPNHYFFKVFFHFYNGDAYSSKNAGLRDLDLESGLLAPTWGDSVESDRDNLNGILTELTDTQEKGENPIGARFNPLHNSAYNFLIRNDELERADKLKFFIKTLSNISTYCPWYFQEITGLDAAMERPIKHDEGYKIEAPKQITIKCMPDSQDDRIGTLLDLYRDIAYSYVWRREVLPANLRKFDMSIYIFSAPVGKLHSKAVMDNTVSGSSIPTSYKCIQLHDCEIDYNCSKGGYSGLNNAEGFQQVYEIVLNVGDIYEMRYNPYIDRMIGDIVATDLFKYTYSMRQHIDQIYVSSPQKDSGNKSKVNRLATSQLGGVDILGTIDNLTGNVASDFIKSQLLGNLHEYSLTDLTQDLGGMARDVMSLNVGGMIKSAEKISEIGNGWYMKKELGNLNADNNIYNRSEQKTQYPTGTLGKL